MPNPFLGVCFHWLGGLASGSFYVPYRGVRKWSWETYWLVGGVFSWIVCPWVLAGLLTRHLGSVLEHQAWSTLAWTFGFGLLWGLGGLTYGLTMRYLGLSLGTGIALGYCAAFGTLLPPVLKTFMPSVPVAESIVQIASGTAGRITLAGVAVCLIGIATAAAAGLAKERAMPDEAKHSAVREFTFGKGFLVATFCGVMSACFAFGLTAGNPISAATLAAGTPPLWSGLPKLVVMLWGGATTNIVWCAILHLRNRTGFEYGSAEAPLVRNYFFSALAGATWYFQFFFYTMGETQMGRFSFASWTLHMASIIIFATMWGWYFREWKGSGKRAHLLIAAGLATLVLSTVVIGWGTYVKTRLGGG